MGRSKIVPSDSRESSKGCLRERRSEARVEEYSVCSSEGDDRNHPNPSARDYVENGIAPSCAPNDVSDRHTEYRA